MSGTLPGYWESTQSIQSDAAAMASALSESLPGDHGATTLTEKVNRLSVLPSRNSRVALSP